MNLLRAARVLVPALLASGCFSYVPAEFQAVPPGENVRVYLSRQGLLDLPALPENGPYIAGRLLRQEPDQLVVRMPVARRQVGFYSEQVGQEIAIRTSDIVQFERRRIDKTGTVLLVAGTAAAAAGVVLLIVEAWGNEQIVEPPPDELRVPLFSIRIGR